MKITKYLTIALTILIFSSTAFAHPDPARKVERLTEKLSLNPDQEAAATEIFENAFSECKEVSDSRRDHKECMRGQKENVHSSLNAILDENQQATFEEMKAERKSQREEHKAQRKARRDNR